MKIGYAAARGDDTENTDYQFQVNALAPSWQHFRLKQLDRDGNFSYSPVTNVKIV